MAESNDDSLQNSTVELNDAYLTAKVPVSLGLIESTFSLDFTVSTNKEVILLDLAGAHLGRLPVPKSLVLPYLKKVLPSLAVVFVWLTTRSRSSFLK